MGNFGLRGNVSRAARASEPDREKESERYYCRVLKLGSGRIRRCHRYSSPVKVTFAMVKLEQQCRIIRNCWVVVVSELEASPIFKDGLSGRHGRTVFTNCCQQMMSCCLLPCFPSLTGPVSLFSCRASLDDGDGA